MKNLQHRLIIALLSIFVAGLVGLSSNKVHAQSYSYSTYDMEGDTIKFSFPPPDSSFFHTRIGMKFLTGVLDYSQLCYSCDTIVETKARPKGARPQDGTHSGEETDYFSQCSEYLLQQKFDLDIVLDPVIRAILSSHGVTYLMRMTAANPCVDTLSLSRLGDTVRIDDFNMMIAYFNNDTSVIPTLTDLYLARKLLNNTSVEIAEPDYKGQAASGSNTPADPFFAGIYPNGAQTSLTMIGINGANGAWEFDVGDSNIAVGVVDGGVDYQRCDLGEGIGSGFKVRGGMDWLTDVAANIVSSPDVHHGTGVASIIGAFTNWPGSGFPGTPNLGCSLSAPNGMAGIAGGWGPIPTAADERSRGVGIFGYNVSVDFVSWSSINAARSILDAANNSIFGNFGKGVDVINFSGTYPPVLNQPYPLLVRNAIAEAFFNAATFVAAKGDLDSEKQSWPSSHEPASEVFAVGSADTNEARYYQSNWGYNVDLVAPGGGSGDSGAMNLGLGIDFDDGDTPTSSDGNPDQAWFVGNTSGAAPHVSGVVALLRGFLKNFDTMAFAREDIEGMLEASCLDLGDTAEDPLHNPRHDPSTGNPPYMPGYNQFVGWGFLQADTLFNMLDPAGKHAYRLFHVEVPDSDIRIPTNWDSAARFDSNFFYQPTTDTGNNPGVKYCDILRREITSNFDYSHLGFGIVNDPLAPVYVWGNTGIPDSGKPKPRGFASEIPNWEESWCEVTSGVTGGYRGNNNVPGIAGIINNHGTKVSVHTFQFLRLTPGTDSVIDTIPTNANLGLGFTVFAPTKLSTSGVKEENPPESFTVWPTIASTNVMATLNGDELARSLELVDAVGMTISTREFVPALHHLEFSVAGIPSGMYILRVMTDNGERDANIIVMH